MTEKTMLEELNDILRRHAKGELSDIEASQACIYAMNKFEIYRWARGPIDPSAK